MLTFYQNLFKPLSHNLSKSLNPPSTIPLIFSFPLTNTISTTKGRCQPKTSFPTLVAASTSRSRSTASPNPNSKSPKSTRNRKKKAKSVVGGDDNVMDLPVGKNENDTILQSEQCDLEKQAPNPSEQISDINPQQPQGGKNGEEQATKDAIFNQFEEMLASIRAENIDLQDEMRDILKERPEDASSDCNGNEESDEEIDWEESYPEEVARKGLVEEEDQEWPLDEDVGWGIRASDYFEKHPIRNVVENGVEIDWEGELDEGWVKEINCLEWESFAFHPSPLVLLVFERYKRPADNWRCLKELEKAAKVYWSCRDRLPPRTVKIDVNIETDLAHALKVTESDCPQLLFLRGNRILYREKEIRDADDLVKMIAHFYYKAKRPEWVDPSAVA